MLGLSVIARVARARGLFGLDRARARRGSRPLGLDECLASPILPLPHRRRL